MEVIIVANAEEAGDLGADLVVKLVNRQPASVLGLATGSSPLPIYRRLTADYRDARVSFANVSAFLLDEYVGLPTNHPESYRRFIQRELVSQIDLPPSALFGPDASGNDLPSAGARYEEMIAR